MRIPLDRPGRRWRAALLAGLALWLGACGETLYDELELMPAPTLYTETDRAAFPGLSEETILDRTQLFYATDRIPAGPDNPQEFYANERGYVLRTGVARVTIDPPVQSWDALKRLTLAPEREEAITLRMRGVEETGVMPFSISRFVPETPGAAEMAAAGRRFAAQIEAQLARSGSRDIIIYTHGYNVDFDYSTLVSKQLQHFLGYRGAFISYNWTATPSRFAYFKDQESAMATRRNLRALIEFLSENTSARRIHLVGYSAGSRLAFETAYQIALQPAPRPRLGRVVLISSDLDRAFFLEAIEDGLLDALDDLTLYQSRTDGALALSQLVFGRERLGQTAGEAQDPTTAAVQARLHELDNLHVIDVTGAERASFGNGHWYFQSSPWASSDLFLMLQTDQDPAERGLVRSGSSPIWRFPPDYPQVLARRAGEG